MRISTLLALQTLRSVKTNSGGEGYRLMSPWQGKKEKMKRFTWSASGKRFARAKA